MGCQPTQYEDNVIAYHKPMNHGPSHSLQYQHYVGPPMGSEALMPGPTHREGQYHLGLFIIYELLLFYYYIL